MPNVCGTLLTDCGSLQKLDVSKNKFGLIGMERLLQVIDISRLRSVDLSDTIAPGHAQHLLKQLNKLLLDSVRNCVFLILDYCRIVSVKLTQ